MAEQKSSPGTIAVFGLGYVGAVTAACLAKVGHRVIGIDSDAHKVESLNAKKAPSYEPGLTEIIEEAVSAGRLSATLNIHEALATADVAMICVGTPSERNRGGAQQVEGEGHIEPAAGADFHHAQTLNRCVLPGQIGGDSGSLAKIGKRVGIVSKAAEFALQEVVQRLIAEGERGAGALNEGFLFPGHGRRFW
jgi:threonine dehydrogenase-like Zn-dependent dehydrogenase